MSHRLWSILCATPVILLACGAEELPSVSAAPVAPISGRYEVEGVTVDVATGSQRDISGTVILSENGSTYTATFDLDTVFPTPEGEFQAEVIGEGSGTIEGRTLTGQAKTQVIISSVAGVDPRFAFIPRRTTTRIVSKSTTTIAADGSVEIEIENEPSEGENYSPTRTTMRGVRVSSAGLGDAKGATRGGE